jgi:Phage portal protein
VDHCLLPWATCWESELNRKLIAKAERSRAYFSHNFNGLVRGDLPTRYAAYKIGRDGGWLSPNDVRRFEDMNPIPDGDTYDPPAVAPANSGARADVVIEKEIVERDAQGRAQKLIEIHRPHVVEALGDGRRGRVSLLAGRTMLEDTVRRSLRRESDRARRAATSVARLQTWAQEFYGSPEADALAGHLSLALAAIAGVPDPAGLARSIASEWHETSLRGLRSLALSGPADVKTAVFNLTNSWLEHRPSAIADAVLARIAS